MPPIDRRRFLVGAASATALGIARPFRLFAQSVVPPSTVFTSGVASGDPTSDGFVLWTRVGLDHFDEIVGWEVFRADAPGSVIASGGALAAGDRDGTLQVAVDGLEEGTEYGYRFSLAGESVEGRTRTFPRNPNRLRIGVVSCSKYSDGYFNAYRELAGMGCDVVLHLGDYIYASRSGATGDPLGRWDTVAGREHFPDRETSTPDDYRLRYQQYRSDPDLRLLHASVPVVSVWDDNDIANNAFRDGNQAGERGDVWVTRKRDGQRAWSEYHPTRAVADANGDLTIWRRFRVGELVDLFMLDTRLQRDEQVSNAAAASTAENDDPSRTMLGAAQRSWLTDGLLESPAAWRILGQGIVMTHWRVVGPPEHIGRLKDEIPLVAGSPVAAGMASGGVYWNSDGWDGYAYERARLFETFGRSGDTIVLTGDVHSSWANELVPEADPLNDPVGVEFVTPAVSTRPFASNVYGATPLFEAAFTVANPWIKYCDMDANGFCVVDLDEDRAIARWYKVDAQTPGAAASPLTAWVTERGSRRVVPWLGDTIPIL